MATRRMMDWPAAYLAARARPIGTIFGYPVNITLDLDGQPIDITAALCIGPDGVTLDPTVVSAAIARAEAGGPKNR